MLAQDTFLAHAFAGMRTLRLADGNAALPNPPQPTPNSYHHLTRRLSTLAGPDEVHMRSIAILELKSKFKARLPKSRL